jgi:large subunit ribosomal protein L22
MSYSYNQDRKPIIFASASDINASFKDLCNVCDAVRYMPVTSAIRVLDGVIDGGHAIEFRRHNRYMGSRHELGGKKGRYPMKCAAIVKKVIVNAAANARNKGEDPEYMYVVHAAANKTQIVPRGPPKGVRAVGGNYGYTTMRSSNLEFARVEIGLADKDTKELGARMKRAVKAISKKEKVVVKADTTKKKTQPKKEATTTQKSTTPPKPLPAPTQAKPADTSQAPAAQTTDTKA